MLPYALDVASGPIIVIGIIMIFLAVATVLALIVGAIFLIRYIVKSSRKK